MADDERQFRQEEPEELQIMNVLCPCNVSNVIKHVSVQDHGEYVFCDHSGRSTTVARIIVYGLFISSMKVATRNTGCRVHQPMT